MQRNNEHRSRGRGGCLHILMLACGWRRRRRRGKNPSFAKPTNRKCDNRSDALREMLKHESYLIAAAVGHSTPTALILVRLLNLRLSVFQFSGFTNPACGSACKNFLLAFLCSS